MKLPDLHHSIPQRILVRGVNWLGDAVMTTPALFRLREHYPAASITLLTHQKLGDLWATHPDFDEVLTFSSTERLFSTARRLRERRFDLAVLLPNSPRSALECWLAGIPIRIGARTGWRSALLTKSVPFPKDVVKMRKRTKSEIRVEIRAKSPKTFSRDIPGPASHHVNQYLRIVASLGANPQPVPPRITITRQEIESELVKYRLNESSSVRIGVNPGAEYGPAKRWPAERFAEVVRNVSLRRNCDWLAFGGARDVSTVDRICQLSAVPVMPLAGRTSLRALMALLASCRSLLTNDTGPMHLAAALGVRVIVPFGSTSPELTGPGLPGGTYHHLLKANVSCSPCFLRECPIDFRCMNGISVEDIETALLKSID